MNYNQFKNISCYEEFEIQCALMGISKIDVLKRIGYKDNDYYFFVSNDGIFNWFDLKGNHVEKKAILKTIFCDYIPKTITKCIIPDGVTYIGNVAFFNCKLLKEITIPDSVISIDKCAFIHCESLTSITIPNTVTYIGNLAFYFCRSLKEMIIPNTVRSIDYKAFAYCESLTSIVISNSVISIGYKAFDECKSLKEVIFKGKTLEEVKRIKYYPFGIKDENVFKFS